MNISKVEQRVLHVLAQGGYIRHQRDDNSRIAEVTCMTGDDLGFSSCDLQVFRKLKRKKLIHSIGGKPYRISRQGRRTVLSQLNNRCTPKS